MPETLSPKPGKSIFITDTKCRLIFVLGVPLFGFLMALIYPTYTKQINNHKTKKTLKTIHEVSITINEYQKNCGELPQSLPELTKKYLGCKTEGDSSYLKSIPKDGWDRDIIYEQNGISYKLHSLGYKGKPIRECIGQEQAGEGCYKYDDL